MRFAKGKMFTHWKNEKETKNKKIEMGKPSRTSVGKKIK